MRPSWPLGRVGSALALGGMLAVAPLTGLLTERAQAASVGGTVVAWGYDRDGETDVPAGLSGVTAVSAGWGFSLALRADGTVAAWGEDDAGQTDVPAGLSGVAAISAGAGFSLALRRDGTVMAWGVDSDGQTDVPAGLSGVTGILAGAGFGLALQKDGTIVAWGSAAQSRLRPPAGLSGVVAISAGSSSGLALRNDGRVVALGYGGAPTGLSGVRAISVGDRQSLFLEGDGTVVASGGYSSRGTSIPAGLSGVTAISAGRYASLALRHDGTVVAWGDDDWGQTDVPADLSDVTAISVGTVHSLALIGGPPAPMPSATSVPSPTALGPAASRVPKSSPARPGSGVGHIVAWGGNYAGQIDVPPGTSSVVAIDASRNASLALRSDGTVAAWGDTSVPSGLSGVTAISVGALSFDVALKEDGTVVAWGDNTYREVDGAAGLSRVTAISAGNSFGLALRTDGTVVGWGVDTYGETDVPAGLSGVIAISAGDDFGLALRSDGTVVAWGFNLDGETDVPAGLSGVIAISAGSSHSLALRSDGTIVAWGDDQYGEADAPAGLSDVVAVSAGNGFSAALKSDGTVVAWGRDDWGQADVPAGLSGVIAIAAGGGHCLALVGSPAASSPSPAASSPSPGASTGSPAASTRSTGASTQSPPGLTGSPAAPFSPGSGIVVGLAGLGLALAMVLIWRSRLLSRKGPGTGVALAATKWRHALSTVLRSRVSGRASRPAVVVGLSAAILVAVVAGPGLSTLWHDTATGDASVSPIAASLASASPARPSGSAVASASPASAMETVPAGPVLLPTPDTRTQTAPATTPAPGQSWSGLYWSAPVISNLPWAGTPRILLPWHGRLIGLDGTLVASSTDLVHWTTLSDGSTGPFPNGRVTWAYAGATDLVAVNLNQSTDCVGNETYTLFPDGCLSAIATSSDGVTWTQAHISAFSGLEVASMAGGPNGLVVVGARGWQQPFELFSVDGSRWQEIKLDSSIFAGADLQSVEAVPGGFVATGRVNEAKRPANDCCSWNGGSSVQAAGWWSADGKTWTRASVEQQNGGGYDLGRVFVTAHGLLAVGMPLEAGDIDAWTSTDGHAWHAEPYALDFADAGMPDVQELDSTFLSGDGIRLIYWGGGDLVETLDGVHWRLLTAGGESADLGLLGSLASISDSSFLVTEAGILGLVTPDRSGQIEVVASTAMP